MERIFKTLGQHKTIDLISYIKDYVKEYPDTQILIGTDSQNHKRQTVYAIVVALYKPGKGAHAIYSRFSENRLYMSKTGDVETQRLLSEVWYSIETAEKIKNELGIQTKYIDIDINPDIRYKSNTVLAQAIGLCSGMNYEVRWKKGEKNAMITYAADHLVK